MEPKISDSNTTVNHEMQSVVSREEKVQPHVMADKAQIRSETGGLTDDGKVGETITIKAATHGLV